MLGPHHQSTTTTQVKGACTRTTELPLPLLWFRKRVVDHEPLSERVVCCTHVWTATGYPSLSLKENDYEQKRLQVRALPSTFCVQQPE